MTDLDELAVQVGRQIEVDYEDWPIATILGARAMLAKLREMGLVVEWRPLREPIGDETVLCANDEAPDFIEATFWNGDMWCCSDRECGRPFLAFTHFAKLPKGPGHD